MANFAWQESSTVLDQKKAFEQLARRCNMNIKTELDSAVHITNYIQNAPSSLITKVSNLSEACSSWQRINQALQEADHARSFLKQTISSSSSEESEAVALKAQQHHRPKHKPFKSYNKQKQVCRNFFSEKGCKHGDKCYRSHSKSDLIEALRRLDPREKRPPNY
jgi:hypothetical protein